MIEGGFGARLAANIRAALEPNMALGMLVLAILTYGTGDARAGNPNDMALGMLVLAILTPVLGGICIHGGGYMHPS